MSKRPKIVVVKLAKTYIKVLCVLSREDLRVDTPLLGYLLRWLEHAQLV